MRKYTICGSKNCKFKKHIRSGKLGHGLQFALICSVQKWGGGLYVRALDEET